MKLKNGKKANQANKQLQISNKIKKRERNFED